MGGPQASSLRLLDDFSLRLEEVLALGLRTDVGITHQVRSWDSCTQLPPKSCRISAPSLPPPDTHTPPISVRLAARSGAQVQLRPDEQKQ